jgi:GAF domain-containing protein
VASDPHYQYHALLPRTSAEIALPLKVGERIIGVLDVRSEHPRVFDPDDVFLLQIVADQIASALEHVRLLGAEQRERELATTLSDVSRIICSSLNLDQVLDLILQQAVLTGFTRYAAGGPNLPQAKKTPTAYAPTRVAL